MLLITNINRTLQKNKCRLHGDRDKTIDHIIKEFSGLAKKGVQE